MKKIYIGIIVLIVLIFASRYYIGRSNRHIEISGMISSIKISDGYIKVFDGKNEPYSVYIDPALSQVVDETGNRKDINYLRRGFSVSLIGTLESKESIKSDELKVSNAPAILVYSPTKGTKVSSPINIYGEARIFSRQLHYAVRNASGTVLGSGDLTVQGGIGVYSPFSGKVSYIPPNSPSGTVDVFQIGKAGEEQDRVSIPVDF